LKKQTREDRKREKEGAILREGSEQENYDGDSKRRPGWRSLVFIS
jgi:hypothetical protein